MFSIKSIILSNGKYANKGHVYFCIKMHWKTHLKREFTKLGILSILNWGECFVNFPVFELLFIIPSCSCVFDGIIFQTPVIVIFCFFKIWNNFDILVNLHDIITILTKLILFSSSAVVFEFRIFLVICYRFLIFLVKCYGKWN